MDNDNLRRVLFALGILALSVYLSERLFLLLQLFASPILLFCLAWLIALILRPAVDSLSRGPNGQTVHVGLHRIFAVAMVYGLLMAITVMVVVAFSPAIGQQLLNVQASLPFAAEEVTRWSTDLEQELLQRGINFNLAPALQPEVLTAQATALGSTLAQQSLTWISGLAAFLTNLIIVLILSFYMTMDGPRLAARTLELLPADWRDEARTFFEIVDRTFGGFLRSQILQSVVYGIGTALVMGMMGLTNITLASVLSAIAVLIPIVGGVLGLIPPLLIALISAPDDLLLTFILLMALQQVLFNIIMPRIVGRVVGLHPLLVFAALLIGSTIAGGWGILFGIPAAGVLGAVIQYGYARAIGRNARTTP